jgi:4a-hydroxytetrahydrobiopterin dehydratase
MSAAPVDIVSRKHAAGGTAQPLAASEIQRLLHNLDGWSLRDGAISKTYRFPNHWQAMAFVNAIAWISHREDHHPEVQLGYDHCRVDYRTHSIQALSESDFNCAAKVDALFAL